MLFGSVFGLVARQLRPICRSGVKGLARRGAEILGLSGLDLRGQIFVRIGQKVGRGPLRVDLPGREDLGGAGRFGAVLDRPDAERWGGIDLNLVETQGFGCLRAVALEAFDQ